jgi:UDP:flavonoid glycosyltransferase YjiC (YdhE family)
MRVLFCCLPAHGHLYPLLPLATALRDVGHDVRFGTGAGFVDRVRGLGFPAEAVGTSIPEAARLAAERYPGRPGPELGLIAFVEIAAAATVADLRPVLAERKPDLVVYEETQFGAAVAARQAGLPAVCHSLSRQLPDARYQAGRRLLAPLWTEGPVPDFFHENPYLDICPPSLRDPTAAEPWRRLSLRPVSMTEPGDGVPEWVTRRTRPLAYLTLGTYVFGAVDALRAAALGLSRLDLDVLVTVGPEGDPARLAGLPASVRVERYVPQDALLPYVDLVAHHGGSGTMFGALALGLPQLLLPHGADQWINAEVLAGAGAGRRLLPAEVTADAVETEARRLLGEPWPPRSRACRRPLGWPPPSRTWWHRRSLRRVRSPWWRGLDSA